MCIAGLGVCAGGWLVVAATLEGKWDHAAVTILATGAGLALVAAVTFACWAMAWRHVLRADGVLIGEARRRSRQQARRQARQAARAARLEAAVARQQARQARREARAMDKRERAHQAAAAAQARVNVALPEPEPEEEATVRIIPGPAILGEPTTEPEPVRPPNADRVLAQLRDLLGPLLTALEDPPKDSRTRASSMYEEAW